MHDGIRASDLMSRDSETVSDVLKDLRADTQRIAEAKAAEQLSRLIWVPDQHGECQSGLELDAVHFNPREFIPHHATTPPSSTVRPMREAVRCPDLAPPLPQVWLVCVPELLSLPSGEPRWLGSLVFVRVTPVSRSAHRVTPQPHNPRASAPN